MALIIYKEEEELLKQLTMNGKHIMVFCSKANIQTEFCTMIEMERLANIPFLNCNDITEYLAENNLTYKGNYIIEGSEGEWQDGQFVTHLNYPLQLACISLVSLYTPIITKPLLFYGEYMISPAKKKDIYLC